MSRLMLYCGIIDDDLSRLSSSLIKKKMKYRDVPIGEEWRVNLSKELLKIQNGNDVTIPGFTSEEYEELIRYVCVA